MDTTNYPPIEPGLQFRYTGTGTVLDGQRRTLGPLDSYGGMEALDDHGVPSDHIDADLASNPRRFWEQREPVTDPNLPEAPNLSLSPLDTRCTFRAIVTLDEPVHVTEQYWAAEDRVFEVTEVTVVWSIDLGVSEPRWHGSARTKGRRILKSGKPSANLTSMYGATVRFMEREAIEASRPVSIPSITWSK